MQTRRMSRLAGLSILGFGAAALFSTVLVSGCEEELVELLFEEEGVWEMTHQDVSGSGELRRLEQGRQEKFLLKFSRSGIDTNEARGELKAAACLDSDGTVSPALGTTCPETFCCRCYSYTYNNNFLRIADTTPEGGAACPINPGEPTDVSLEALPDLSNTYIFRPFQPDMFACENDTCSYAFQGGRANSKFEATGCEEFCNGG